MTIARSFAKSFFRLLNKGISSSYFLFHFKGVDKCFYFSQRLDFTVSKCTMSTNYICFISFLYLRY